MSNEAALVEVLKTLDPDNDDHWTTDGQPRVDIVSEKLGTETTRAAIKTAVPDFTRQAFVDQLAQLGVENYNNSNGSENGSSENDDGSGNSDQDDEDQDDEDQDDEDQDDEDQSDQLKIDRDDNFETLTEKLNRAEKKLLEVGKIVDEARQKRDELRLARDRLIEAKERKRPKNHNQNEIKRYLKSQEEARKKRSEQSSLDKAFSRHTSRPAPRFNPDQK